MPGSPSVFLKRVVGVLLYLAATLPLLTYAEDLPPPDEQISIEGIDLRLFGRGIRDKFLIDIYECSIYLEKMNNRPIKHNYKDHGLAIKLKILTDRLPDTPPAFWLDIFNKTLDEEDTQEILQGFSELQEGDTLTIAYLPGKGTIVSTQERRLLKNPSPDLMIEIIEGLIGTTPVSEDLKQALLEPVE